MGFGEKKYTAAIKQKTQTQGRTPAVILGISQDMLLS